MKEKSTDVYISVLKYIQVYFHSKNVETKNHVGDLDIDGG